MVSAYQAAQAAARKAIEEAYSGMATVTERKKIRDERTKITKEVPVIVLEDQPCKLSYETLQAASDSGLVSAVTQVTKLFISPDVSIREGSKITVVQNGVTDDYAFSGIPAVFPTHQEIVLKPFERWA